MSLSTLASVKPKSGSMLRSMTGFGEATAEGRAFVLSLELKSVNNRFLKVSIKVPDEVSYLQNELEERIRESLLRGSVFLTVHFTPTRYEDLYEIDEDVLRKYLTTLKGLSSRLNLKEEIHLKDLLLLPGVIHTEETLVLGKEEVLPVAVQALGAAMAKLLQMRAVEGARLEQELRERSQVLRTLLEKVKQAAPRALAEYQQKLEERVNGLLSQKGVTIAPEDLLKEVAILAERSDIAEEIQRFECHLDQFVASLDEQEPVGRKLEFLVQELFRESNTMSAKSSSTVLNQAVVEIKAEVDRIKEQVANIE